MLRDPIYNSFLVCTYLLSFFIVFKIEIVLVENLLLLRQTGLRDYKSSVVPKFKELHFSICHAKQCLPVSCSYFVVVIRILSLSWVLNCRKLTMLATECSLPLYPKVSQSFQLHFFSIFPSLCLLCCAWG